MCSSDGGSSSDIADGLASAASGALLGEACLGDLFGEAALFFGDGFGDDSLAGILALKHTEKLCQEWWDKYRTIVAKTERRSADLGSNRFWRAGCISCGESLLEHRLFALGVETAFGKFRLELFHGGHPG